MAAGSEESDVWLCNSCQGGAADCDHVWPRPSQQLIGLLKTFAASQTATVLALQLFSWQPELLHCAEEEKARVREQQDISTSECTTEPTETWKSSKAAPLSGTYPQSPFFRQ
ncbi:unnamed protein product [Bubo scandiacus]